MTLPGFTAIAAGDLADDAAVRERMLKAQRDNVTDRRRLLFLVKFYDFDGSSGGQGYGWPRKTIGTSATVLAVIRQELPALDDHPDGKQLIVSGNVTWRKVTTSGGEASLWLSLANDLTKVSNTLTTSSTSFQQDTLTLELTPEYQGGLFQLQFMAQLASGSAEVEFKQDMAHLWSMEY